MYVHSPFTYYIGRETNKHCVGDDDDGAAVMIMQMRIRFYIKELCAFK